MALSAVESAALNRSLTRSEVVDATRTYIAVRARLAYVLPDTLTIVGRVVLPQSVETASRPPMLLTIDRSVQDAMLDAVGQDLPQAAGDPSAQVLDCLCAAHLRERVIELALRPQNVSGSLQCGL